MASTPTPASQYPSHTTKKSSTLICTSLTAPTISAQLDQLAAAAAAGADLAELRLDLLYPTELPNWHQIVQKTHLPLIVTNRPVWEGGKSTADERERLALLIEAVDMGVAYIDVELKAAQTFWELQRESTMRRTKLILSYHDFERPLSRLQVDETVAQMREKGAHIAKIAMTATSALDNCTVFSALLNTSMPTILLAMGELGRPSRVLGGRFGAYLTFASVKEGEESAPGQVDLDTLLNAYRFAHIGRHTRLYGVIGNPVMQSMGPVLHNTVFREKGLDAAYVHLLVEANVARFIHEMSALGFEGFSVTIPAKVDAIDAMGEIEDAVKRIGAMNTVVRDEEGHLKGSNTDWLGAMDAICEQTGGDLNGKRVLVLGAGGAGKALIFGALERGAQNIVVANRTKEKAVSLAESFGEKVSGIGMGEIEEAGAFDVLVNTTSIGMVPKVEECPLDVGLLRKGMIVFDAVYNPLETRLLREARERGASCVSGVEMFVRQAARQFETWFPNLEAPVEVMRETVVRRLQSNK